MPHPVRERNRCKEQDGDKFAFGRERRIRSPQDWQEVRMTGLTVRDVALAAPITVGPQSSIGQAEHLLIVNRGTDVYVVDSQERLLGVVPDYEILKHRLLDGNPEAAISTMMTPVTVWLLPNAGLEAAARLLRQHIHASLPILEDGRLIGLLSRTNLMRILTGNVQVDRPTHGVIPAPCFLRLARETAATSLEFTL
jgi:CBS domain-containing protein